MRTVLNLNQGWLFSKDAAPAPGVMAPNAEQIDLPHSWNAHDGQDGGNDYHRGTCLYEKVLKISELPAGEKLFLEFQGANSSADVYLDGKHLCHHDGGYSTFRVNVTGLIGQESHLVVAVDNAPSQTVYPQMADFTFYGGLYRDVNLIAVPASHFDLETWGGPGLRVTPQVCGADAEVTVEVSVTNLQPGQTLCYQLLDGMGRVVAETESADCSVTLRIPSVRLWDGRKDPYLYTARVTLDGGLDSVEARFGCRTFQIDPQRGFILNGREYPLRGVSRHQDRWGAGNALTHQMHVEDIDLICEMGATTIRLAHYQHDQYFYDLCDQRGLVLWAEIPYISQHMPGGRENTVSQMQELITQNYNHPSIVVWGLSNEITMKGASDPDLLENHHILNDLCHRMDKTRLTTMAVVSMCDMHEEYVRIPDVVSYNHYFGWYGGNTSMNGPWFDKFHKEFPNQPIGVSEYGCEALNWHTSNPTQGDYTEEYQAYYHEELIKQLFSRKYLWATHVWNMFDFGADARSEGGENGQNHKGLVTFDRKYKKDAFYAYKAWLSDEPFVHICGKRYVDRVEDVTKVTVYSNQPSVELFVNGESLGVQESPEHFFYFQVPNVGRSHLVAVAGAHRDEACLCKVDQFNESYRLKEKGAILNWFDITEPEGYLSINCTIDDILATVRGKLLMGKFFMDMVKSMNKNKDGKPQAAGFEINESMMKMMGGFTVIRLTNMAGTMNISFSKEQLLELNASLNKIKRKEK